METAESSHTPVRSRGVQGGEMRRAPVAIAVVGCVVLAASGCVLVGLAGQRHAARLREAKAALGAGAPAKARAILEGESVRWPWGDGETEYLRGVSEKR